MKYSIYAKGTLCALPLGVLLLSHLETRRFEKTVCEIPSPRIAGESVRVVFLTDLHNCRYGKNNRKLMAAVRQARPDLVIVAGDMIVGKEKADFEPALELMGQLAERYPVFYGNGNHETRMREKMGGSYEEYTGKLRDMGVHLLVNAGTDFYVKGSCFHIYGLEIERKYYQRGRARDFPPGYLEKLLPERKGDGMSLLIAHNPDYFPQYARWGADVTFSGHVHGGIVRIPGIGGLLSPKLELFPRYDAGVFWRRGKAMVLSRGIGSHFIPVRLCNPPELMTVVLYRGAARHTAGRETHSAIRKERR